MNNKLKPCPFCGCDMTFLPSFPSPTGEISYSPAPIGKSSRIGEHKRGCILNDVVFTGMTKRKLVARWNRRANNELAD